MIIVVTEHKRYTSWQVTVSLVIVTERLDVGIHLCWAWLDTVFTVVYTNLGRPNENRIRMELVYPACITKVSLVQLPPANPWHLVFMPENSREGTIL